MAEVSYLQPHGNDDDEDDDDDDEEYDDRDEVVVSFHPDNNCSCDLDGFDLYPSDLDCLSFDGFLCHTDRNPTRISPNEDDSVLFDRENQMNFVIDMFHQRVEQSQSQSQSHSASPVIIDSDSGNLDRSLGPIGGNEGPDANDLGLGLGFPVEVNNERNNGDDNSGFMLADCGDDFFVSRRTLNARSESENPSNRSVGPEYIMEGFRVPDLGSDTDVAGENDIDFATDAGRDVESNLRLSWDAFQLEDDNDRGNQDFEWEEVDDRIDDREILNMIFESEADDDLSVLPDIPIATHELEEQQPDTSSLEWEVLLNVHNLEGTQDLAGGHYDEYNYAEYDMLFEQFADADVSSLGRPPAARTVVENLLSVVMTELDLEKNDALCAVCKDEIGVGLMGKQLPCGHRYHGDCIVPWLSIRNTCPVCRHELPTDDLDYERRRAERGARDR
ncbi:uncharacterized protein LOC112511781 [Cynara cardunculus var. scolymus]|uniref:RING-type E3 ubiquitin transferase n=1 Tax=Cynara cardunculus var. scolymus TaxID=59895 RepID=A0A103XX49_CYNCS|nr:uncharacterized protein LOC112511781 [Cynara cardunculus var. scolymus]KVH98488.1 Zinc finger, RING/FYVE/PHD-type [Cynara cardunculus var. scolymus]